VVLKPLITHEIGSLAKPHWRVKAMSGTPLDENDIEEAQAWGQRLHIAYVEELLNILSKKKDFTEGEKEKIFDFSTLYAIKLLESAGIDLVWDGEQHRIEMYEYPIKNLSGFTFHGHVRSFENKYYRKASCERTPECNSPYHLKEFREIQQLASKEVKIPITGAYTLVDWSYDAFYFKKVAPGVEDINEKRTSARKQFLKDIATGVIYPNLKALHEAGAKYLQIDEPAAATKRGETDLFIQSMKDSIGDLAGKVFFSVHICYSVYARLFPDVRQLEGILDEIHLEYANRDSKELGRNPKVRSGYDILKEFRDTKFVVGLGVLDIHSDFIESPELVRDRILYACDIIKDPSRIMVAPDCGLRTRTWEVAYQKLHNMVEGRNLALKELGF
jgi:5-methyltetrahydropteroyltriglutamate--homocysteine methyltransferase